MSDGTKMAMVAAVSAALKYKNENPGMKDEEVINYIVRISGQIINRMGM